MLEGDGALDYPMVEVALEPERCMPDVFPGFVGVEELVLVEERDAVVVELAFFFGSHKAPLPSPLPEYGVRETEKKALSPRTG